MRIKLTLVSIFLLGNIAQGQYINFKDTNALAKLLCSHAWICYDLNRDFTFSDKIFDSIRYYPDRTWGLSSHSKNDTSDCEGGYYKFIGRYWYFGETGKVWKNDSVIDKIVVNGKGHLAYPDYGEGGMTFTLIDGLRLKNTEVGKWCGNILAPFLISDFVCAGISRRFLWQAPIQFKKNKSNNHEK